MSASSILLATARSVLRADCSFIGTLSAALVAVSVALFLILPTMVPTVYAAAGERLAPRRTAERLRFWFRASGKRGRICRIDPGLRSRVLRTLSGLAHMRGLAPNFCPSRSDGISLLPSRRDCCGSVLRASAAQEGLTCQVGTRVSRRIEETEPMG